MLKKKKKRGDEQRRSDRLDDLGLMRRGCWEALMILEGFTQEILVRLLLFAYTT